MMDLLILLSGLFKPYLWFAWSLRVVESIPPGIGTYVNEYNP